MRMILGLATAVMMLAINVEAKDWETDFAKTSAAAKESGKYILLDFSGSDWCGWCVRLDKEVFSTKEFHEYEEGNLHCVLVDSPRKKKLSDKLNKQNGELKNKYGVHGYPTVIILSPNGELVGKTGYQEGGPKEYVKHLEKMIGKHKAEQKKVETEQKRDPSVHSTR